MVDNIDDTDSNEMRLIRVLAKEAEAQKAVTDKTFKDLSEHIKPGQLFLAEVFSTQDHTICHGFGANERLFTAHDLYLCKASDEPMRTSDPMPDRVKILLEKNIQLDGNPDHYIFGIENNQLWLDTSHIHAIKFNGSKDLAEKRREAYYKNCEMCSRTNGTILGVNVYLGDLDPLLNTAVLFLHEPMLHVLKLVDVPIPNHLAEEVRSDTQERLAGFFHAAISAGNKMSNADKMAELKVLREDIELVPIKEIIPFEGVTVNVAKFLDGVERSANASQKLRLS